MAARDALSEVVSEDVSTVPISCSVAPSSIEYGLGSDAGRCMMGFGELVQDGLNAVLIWRRLSSIKTQLRVDCTTVGKDEKACQHLLELSRRGLYSARVKSKAWSMIFLLISEGETQGLLNAIIKWPEIEVQLFIQDAVKHMPNDWIFDPLSHNRTSEHLRKTFPQLQDNSKLAIGLLRLLSSLMKSGFLVDRGKKRNSKRDSPAFSLSSFVSASGKMVLGPLAFQYNVKIHIGSHALLDVVKSIICGRLNTIATRLKLEVSSYDPSKEMIGLFSELLLIYRLFSEDRTVYRQTQELLFNAISRNHAVALTRIMASWSREELTMLLGEVSPWMVPFLYASSTIGRQYPKAFRAYLASHSHTSHPILPFLYFLIHFARSSELAACLLLDLDVVKTLKRLCLQDFPNPAASVISTTVRMDRIALSDVYASLILLFAALASHPKSCARMLRGRNVPFWFLSVYYTADFLGLPNQLHLQHTWKDLERTAMKLVLVALEHVLKGENIRDNVDFLPLKEIYQDLIGVLSDPKSDSDMLNSAADCLLTCVEFGGDFRRILNDVLGERRLEETITIIKAIVQSLAPDFYPVPDIRIQTRSGDAHRYLTGLAHAYALEYRMFSPLVGVLFGSAVCDATYTFSRSGAHSPLVFRHESVDSLAIDYTIHRERVAGPDASH